MISIVVPTYNNPRALDDCLRSLVGLDYPKDGYEIVVVHHGPNRENTRKVVQKYSAKYVAETNPNVSVARNRGIKETKGEIVLFMDEDVKVPPDSLKKVKDRFLRDPSLVCLGARDMPFEDDSYMAKCFFYQGRFAQDYFYVYRNDYMKLKSNFLAFRRKAFDIVGPFNPNSMAPRHAPEDSELIYRLTKANLKFSCAGDLVVFHHFSLSKAIKRLKWLLTSLPEIKAIEHSFKIWNLELIILLSFLAPLLFAGMKGFMLYTFFWLSVLAGLSAIMSAKMSKSIKFCPGILTFQLLHIGVGILGSLLNCYLDLRTLARKVQKYLPTR